MSVVRCIYSAYGLTDAEWLLFLVVFVLCRLCWLDVYYMIKAVTGDINVVEGRWIFSDTLLSGASPFEEHYKKA